MSETEVRWVDVGEMFGSAMANGSCNAAVGDRVCGYPRRPDGTCLNGHPAPPEPDSSTRSTS